MASCAEASPDGDAVSDHGAAADVMAQGSGGTQTAGVGGSVGPDAGGGAGGAQPTGTGGAGGAGGSAGAGGGGTRGAPGYPVCASPAPGSTIDGLGCTKLVGDVSRATRRDGFICTTGCLWTTAGGRPAGYAGEPLHPACVFAPTAGRVPEYICVGSCQGCQP